jgi:hypothetical protein
MKFPSKIAPMVVVAALSLAGLGAVTAAFGGDWGHSGWGMGPHQGGKHHMCDRHGHGDMRGPHGPGRLAEKLSVMETEIGIRPTQLDAWRDFTDALLATMGPPMGPPSAMTVQGDDAKPFSLPESLADHAIDRAKSAEDLKKAITTLRTTLTSEQLDKVKAIEARIRARFAQHGFGPHGPGPHDMGRGMGPQGGPPPPSDTPDTPDDDGGDE